MERVGRFQWEFGYPGIYAVQGALFTLLYLTYAAVLVWRGRTFVRGIAAPLLLLVPWFVESFRPVGLVDVTIPLIGFLTATSQRADSLRF